MVQVKVNLQIPVVVVAVWVVVIQGELQQLNLVYQTQVLLIMVVQEDLIKLQVDLGVVELDVLHQINVEEQVILLLQLHLKVILVELVETNKVVVEAVLLLLVVMLMLVVLVVLEMVELEFQ